MFDCVRSWSRCFRGWLSVLPFGPVKENVTKMVEMSKHPLNKCHKNGSKCQNLELTTGNWSSSSFACFRWCLFQSSVHDLVPEALVAAAIATRVACWNPIRAEFQGQTYVNFGCHPLSPTCRFPRLRMGSFAIAFFHRANLDCQWAFGALASGSLAACFWAISVPVPYTTKLAQSRSSTVCGSLAGWLADFSAVCGWLAGGF